MRPNRTSSHGRSTWLCRALALAALSSAGCSGEDGPKTSPEPQAEPEPIRISDANNYRATGSLSLPRIQTASAVDLDICWSNLESDLLCHDVAPATDIDNVGLIRISQYTQAEVEERLAADDLPQAAVDGYVEYPTSDGETCTKLSSFSFFETMIELEDHYVESDRAYLLLFTTGTSAGIGARSMIFLEPKSESDRTRVDAPSGCGTLDFTADLGVAEPLVVSAGGPWLFEWRDLIHNGLGNEAFHSSIDRALLGFYADRTLSELEAGIFDLEISATELYAIELAGERTVDMALAREATTGAEFSGFERESEGVWLFGLLCSTCRNPAPVSLSVVTLAGEGT
jgi:hypothetical protein